jgi:hypothetical protein
MRTKHAVSMENLGIEFFMLPANGHGTGGAGRDLD